MKSSAHAPVRYSSGRTYSRLFLLVVPMASFILGFYLSKPFWPVYGGYQNLFFGYDYDPSYAYLFNGLAIAKFSAPGIVSHPGTTAFVIISAFLRFYQLALWSISGNFYSLTSLLISRPEAVLRFVAVCNLAVYGGLLWLLGTTALLELGTLVGACLIQCIPVLYAEFVGPAILNAEATGILLGVSLFALFLVEWSACRSDDLRRRQWSALLIGLNIGALIIAKITFLPFVLFVFAFMTYRRMVLAFFGLAFGIIIFLIPDMSRLGDMARWFFRLATHTGQYGSGGSGVFDLPVMFDNMPRLLVAYFPVFIIFLASLALAMLVMRRERYCWRTATSDWRLRFVIVSLMVASVQTLMVLKELQYHYFLPSVIAASLLLGLGAFLVFENPKRTRRAWILSVGLLLAYTAWFGVFRWPDLPDSSAMSHVLAQRNASIAALREFKANHTKAIWVGTYRVHDKDFALAFGAAYGGTGVANLIARGNFPPLILYNRWNKRFWINGVWAPARKINSMALAGRNIFLLVPNDLDVTSIKLHLKLERTFANGVKAFHVIPAVQGTPASAVKNRALASD